MRELYIDDYIIVLGTDKNTYYDEYEKILNLNCNDLYEGLPEKILKTFKFCVEDSRLKEYTHFIKLDDDCKVRENIPKNILKNLNYGGIIETKKGDKTWHIGKCTNESYYSTNFYKGSFVPWCRGGNGYILSRYAINLIKNDENYYREIYEDLYIAKLLYKYKIFPKNLNKIITIFISNDNHIKKYK